MLVIGYALCPNLLDTTKLPTNSIWEFQLSISLSRLDITDLLHFSPFSRCEATSHCSFSFISWWLMRLVQYKSYVFIDIYIFSFETCLCESVAFFSVGLVCYIFLTNVLGLSCIWALCKFYMLKRIFCSVLCLFTLWMMPLDKENFVLLT